MIQVEEITRTVCDDVFKKEPGVLQYQWFRAGGSETPLIVVWETYVLGGQSQEEQIPLTFMRVLSRYVDEAAVENHKSSPIMAWLMENDKKEENFAAPLKIMPLEQFAGWESRS
jgi:quinol monooxygenase YgiN